MLTKHPLWLTVLVLPLMAGLAFGQGLTGFGAKAGLNLANIGGADATKDSLGADPDMKLGLALGGYATFDFGLPVLIQPEVLFSQKGYKIDVSEDFFGETLSIAGAIGLNYLDINLLAVYPINDQISVFAGPSLGQFLSGKSELTVEIGGESDTVEEDIESDDMNGMDYGLIIGGGYNLGMLSVEARYSLGLKKAINEDLDMKNNVIQVMVGYSF